MGAALFQRRAQMVSDFLTPVYRAWLTAEVASGRIVAHGWTDPHRRAAWLQARWNGCPMPDIDPLKSANAAKVNIETGALTLDNRARELNGSDGASNRAKLRRELQELPVPPWAAKQLEQRGQDDAED